MENVFLAIRQLVAIIIGVSTLFILFYIWVGIYELYCIVAVRIFNSTPVKRAEFWEYLFAIICAPVAIIAVIFVPLFIAWFIFKFLPAILLALIVALVVGGGVSNYERAHEREMDYHAGRAVWLATRELEMENERLKEEIEIYEREKSSEELYEDFSYDDMA